MTEQEKQTRATQPVATRSKGGWPLNPAIEAYKKDVDQTLPMYHDAPRRASYDAERRGTKQASEPSAHYK